MNSCRHGCYCTRQSTTTNGYHSPPLAFSLNGTWNETIGVSWIAQLTKVASPCRLLLVSRFSKISHVRGISLFLGYGAFCSINIEIRIIQDWLSDCYSITKINAWVIFLQFCGGWRWHSSSFFSPSRVRRWFMCKSRVNKTQWTVEQSRIHVIISGPRTCH